MEPQDFVGGTPRFVLEEYFAGTTRAWGLFEDRFGDIRRRFSVDINGWWDDQQFVMEEEFAFADGEADHRIWRINKIDDNTYEGTADGVVGTATGLAFGNVLNWRYTFNLQIGKRNYKVRFNDWMFLQEGGLLINRAHVRKFGILLGSVTLVFQQVGPSQAG